MPRGTWVVEMGRGGRPPEGDASRSETGLLLRNPLAGGRLGNVSWAAALEQSTIGATNGDGRFEPVEGRYMAPSLDGSPGRVRPLARTRAGRNARSRDRDLLSLYRDLRC